MNKFLLLAATTLIFNQSLRAQADYTSRKQLGERIRALSANYPDYVHTQVLTRTYGGSDIWMITIGKGETEKKPAIAVVGGVEGKHLLGMELAIGFAENILANATVDSVRMLLDSQVFYVFPNMSPDATERYFGSPRYESSGNARPIDNDRDGKTSEDGYEDLDKDGMITMIRIEDPTGTYIPNPSDPRSMIQADKTKGQIGRYLVYSEGIDNDKDGYFNEDPYEGVHFNKNLTYNYTNFIPGAGEYAVSEIETRALLDFLYDAYNVYAVVTFGPNNNLAHSIPTPRAGLTTSATAERTTVEPSAQGRRGGGSRQMTQWHAADVQSLHHVASMYKEMIDSPPAVRTTAGTGDFSEWAYYHYGRMSFSTPGWWVPRMERTAEANTRSGNQQRVEPGEDPVANYLQWADKEKISTSIFSDWTEITHPDFPGKKVEVGGLHPFVLHNPPAGMISDLVEKHTRFIGKLAGMAPFIGFTDVRTEKIDEGLTRVSLKVFNHGLLPTLTHVGERSYFLKRIAVNVDLSADQRVISGKQRQTLGAIPGRGYVELSWLIQGKGAVTIGASSPNTGSDRVELSL